MPKGTSLKGIGISWRVAVTNILMIGNAFTWYFLAFNVFREALGTIDVTTSESLVFWGINFAAIAVAGLIGAILVERFKRRIPFILYWILAGVILSLLPSALDLTNYVILASASTIFGIYFGLGMTACMGYYADSTSTENRARLGGVMFLFVGLGFFLLGTMTVGDIPTQIIMLATWRGIGFLILVFLKPIENPLERSDKTSYATIISKQSFLLYFIPWCMFSLVNYATIPVTIEFFGEEFVVFSSLIENILIATFAVISGFLADLFGRKRLTIMGFAMLGLGYAVLGIYPENSLSWYLYTFIDGIAWGSFYTIFLIVLWGDLARGQRSEKYYAIGSLPFLFSNFVRVIVESYVVEAVSVFTIFSFASFFLFLAVIPLMYAPETLPEKKIELRRLKGYLEHAKKAKEKYLKKNGATRS